MAVVLLLVVVTAARHSRRFCSITVALGEGPGKRRWPARARRPFAERCSFALRRLSPPPSAAAPPPSALQTRLAKSSEISTAARPGAARPGTAILPRIPALRPPGPSLPTPPGEEKNSLSSVHSAARRSLPLRPGLGRQSPRDWWKSRSPLPPSPAPTRKIASFDPCGSATFACNRAPPLSCPCSREPEADNKNTKTKQQGQKPQPPPEDTPVNSSVSVTGSGPNPGMSPRDRHPSPPSLGTRNQEAGAELLGVPGSPTLASTRGSGSRRFT